MSLLFRSVASRTTRSLLSSIPASATARHGAAVAAIHSTSHAQLPMTPGTPIPGLDFIKNQDPPVALDEYPEWLHQLPLKSLAQLRRMPEAEATDREKMRYLKLTRKILIKQRNEVASASK
ncbi:hypothetical protein MPSEU_000286400 [Mayamaea pseudoterrestris]|nr:hypothetical protein MPSEU_000286400 [Mayamaea pseudoterrestris]